MHLRAYIGVSTEVLVRHYAELVPTAADHAVIAYSAGRSWSNEMIISGTLRADPEHSRGQTQTLSGSAVVCGPVAARRRRDRRHRASDADAAGGFTDSQIALLKPSPSRR